MRGFTKLDNELLFSPELSAYSKLVLASLNYYTRGVTPNSCSTFDVSVS